MRRFQVMPAGLLCLPLVLPPSAAGQAGGLDAVAFMAGTWCSAGGPGATVIEEHYTTPSANLVLGTTRYLRDGVTVGHEFSRVAADTTSVVLTPMPSGQPTVPFRMTTAAPGRVVFENPDHDFPVRIEYERSGDALVARALGADGEGPEWRMSPCGEGVSDGAEAAPMKDDLEGAAVFGRLAGAWEGSGTLFDAPATFTMRWAVADGLATLRFSNALVDEAGDRTQVLAAVGTYRVEGTPEGIWLDSRGERVELAWEIREGALVVRWQASSEAGRTTYRPVGDATVEVVDEVRAAEGWRVFGRATHRRVEPAP